jgi:Cu+-exporting ATPase
MATTSDATVTHVAPDATPDGTFAERHLADTRRRLIVATVFTIPLLLGLATMTIAPFLPSVLMNPWLQLALATPVQFYSGKPFYKGAWNALKHGSSDMNTLIAVGTSAAYFYSLAAILFPGFFEVAGMGNGGSPPLYFDTSAAIITLILLGRLLERAREATSDAIEAHRPGAAHHAWCVMASNTTSIEVVRGDMLIVRPAKRWRSTGSSAMAHPPWMRACSRARACPPPSAPVTKSSVGR